MNEDADATKPDPTPIVFGIRTTRPDERAERLADGLEAWRSRFTARTFAFTEEAALNYGQRMGEARKALLNLEAPRTWLES